MRFEPGRIKFAHPAKTSASNRTKKIRVVIIRLTTKLSRAASDRQCPSELSDFPQTAPRVWLQRLVRQARATGSRYRCVQILHGIPIADSKLYANAVRIFQPT